MVVVFIMIYNGVHSLEIEYRGGGTVYVVLERD